MERGIEMALLEASLSVKTAEDEEETEETHTTEAGSHKGHKTNDRQQ